MANRRSGKDKGPASGAGVRAGRASRDEDIGPRDVSSSEAEPAGDAGAGAEDDIRSDDTARSETRASAGEGSLPGSNDPAQEDERPEEPARSDAPAADHRPQGDEARHPQTEDESRPEAGDRPGEAPRAGQRRNRRSRSAHAFLLLTAALSDDARRLGSAAAAGARRAAEEALPLAARGRAWLASRRAGHGAKPVPPEEGSQPAAATPRRLTRPEWVRRWGTPRAASAAALVAAALVFSGFAYWVLHDLPYEAILGEGSEPMVVLEDAEGELLLRRGPFRAETIALTDFPAHTIQAVIAIEDRRYWDHWGIDLRGITRAAFRNISAGRVVQGGSTITQQLVKIRHLDHTRTFKRKFQEAVLAFTTEQRLGKDEILERYLNEIYLGAGAHGMPAAARRYFDKDVSELTVAESAMLAGMIRAPSQLNPIENLPAARDRARTVLQVMRAEGYLEEDAVTEAELRTAELGPTQPASGSGSWFADWVIESAEDVAGTFKGAVTLRTTLDPRLQAAAEEAVGSVLAESGEAANASQAAMVAMRPDGAVVAMVGGRDYSDSEFNRAVQAQRQPGSTFKLFVYYAAMKQGLTPQDRVNDQAIDIDGYRPENFSGRYHGRVSLAEAFARSLNAASVRLAMDVGLDRVVAAAEELGIEAELMATPSLALGASEVTLLDLTEAYAAIRAGRTPIEAHGLQGFSMGEEGRFFRIGPPSAPPGDLSALQRPLVAMMALAVERGTGQAAKLDGFAAGKTGTSQENRDAWFVGFNEALVVGVWVGNDDSSPMEGVTGGGLPAEIWKRFMTAAASAAGTPELRDEPQEGEAVVETEDDAPDASTVAAGQLTSVVESPRCNVRACSRAYRSFRASDCTFQPYSGPRKLCEK